MNVPEVSKEGNEVLAPKGTMNNPWKNLSSESPCWVLPEDRESIDRFNNNQRSPKTRIVTESIPEPFVGNPESAKLVLLALNPGHLESDITSQRDPVFREAMFLNLKHELRNYPFHPLNPEFSHTGAAKWWKPILGPLKEESRLTDAELSRALMVIEWFPYHSEKSGLPRKQVCGSQGYSLFLAKRMLNRDGVIVLGMRSKDHWSSSDPAFRNVPFLKGKQRPWVSRRNMDEGLFENILKLLSQ